MEKYKIKKVYILWDNEKDHPIRTTDGILQTFYTKKQIKEFKKLMEYYYGK
jgi:hypothetical protein